MPFRTFQNNLNQGPEQHLNRYETDIQETSGSSQSGHSAAPSANPQQSAPNSGVAMVIISQKNKHYFWASCNFQIIF